MTLRFSRTCPIFFLFLIEKRSVILLFLHRRYTKDIVDVSRTSRYVLLVKYDNNEFYSLSSIHEQQTQRFILFRVNKNRRQTQRKFFFDRSTREKIKIRRMVVKYFSFKMKRSVRSASSCLLLCAIPALLCVAFW